MAQRNQVRTQQSFPPLNQLAQVAHDRYAEFRALKPAPSPSRPKRRAQWKPPDQDTFKINFDGAIFAEEKCSGLAVIIRNQKGLVMASMAPRVPQQLQPIEIEALVACKALEFAKEVGIYDAVLEGNSLLVMTTLKTKNPALAPFGDGMGHGYGGVVGRGEVGRCEVGHGEVGHGLTVEVSGF
ncbi:hypothetical protein CMV_004842 [Castanea mollissima]|uniref:RNase H type-1 domain-containing protein n=1 Tax=Castanea mollissima TaxID=60419 RepID=A0A8J4W206_9ROSI|nr:hypothetical protein CMV_004842 [Castanea mollissima]